jgi:hypothetical protein
VNGRLSVVCVQREKLWADRAWPKMDEGSDEYESPIHLQAEKRVKWVALTGVKAENIVCMVGSSTMGGQL